MKRLFFVHAHFLNTLGFGGLFFLFCLGTLPAHGTVRNWTNTSGGSWFDPSNWSPSGVPGSSDAVTITNDGTYTVLVQTGSVSAAVITLGGGSGTQSLIYGTSSGPLFISNSMVQANGLLLVTNGGLQGALLVQAGAQLQLDSSPGLFLYNFALTNRGTITWSNGSLAVGGNNSDRTIIANEGLMQITGNNNINYGGGGEPVLINSGTVQKLLGTGTTFLGIDVINLPAGIVDVSAGTLTLAAVRTNILGGSFNATAPGQMKFWGTTTDAGGVASGSGIIQFNNGTFYLRTNTIPQLNLAGGDVYIDANSFQQEGAITNLTLEGSQLRGTNRVAGMLTVNAGNLLEKLTIEPGAELMLAAPGVTLLYSFVLVNQGTVYWSGGPLSVGGTIISNAGTWTMISDASMNYGGGSPPLFINSGTVQKIAGTGISNLGGVTFLNQPQGILSVATGTLELPNNYTNTAGTLALDGGTLTAPGALAMTGGLLDGTGTIGIDAFFDGGTVSPGLGGAGLIQFKSGLILGPNATVVIDGTGTTAGTQFDQLSVNGALALNNCTLQVTSLPAVPAGTSFEIINNSAAGAVSGTFNALPDNSLLTVGSQLFRISYAGGTGNDVVLTGASVAGPLLSNGGYGNGALRLLGTGSSSHAYNIQATTDFLQWTTVATATADPAGNFTFTDTNAGSFPYRFYRAAN